MKKGYWIALSIVSITLNVFLLYAFKYLKNPEFAQSLLERNFATGEKKNCRLFIFILLPRKKPCRNPIDEDFKKFLLYWQQKRKDLCVGYVIPEAFKDRINLVKKAFNLKEERILIDKGNILTKKIAFLPEIIVVSNNGRLIFASLLTARTKRQIVTLLPILLYTLQRPRSQEAKVIKPNDMSNFKN